MQPAEIARAKETARATAAALGLAADDATVLHNSNKLALRLLPCDVFARVAFIGQEVARFEVELAQRLGEAGGPVADLEPRVPARVYERDGFSITLWTYYEQGNPADISPADYADALARLHAGMREVEIASPHFTDRIREAQAIVANVDDRDHVLISDALRSASENVGKRAAPEQLLHGEPHPGNVLNSKDGLRFIDLETCCRGPVEFDLAHVPEAVSGCYPDADAELLRECRLLVLAMVAAWRCEPGDELPNRERALHALLDALRAGPPWATLDQLTP
jgi:hypothetical protein